MRLDAVTLTSRQYQELINALLEIAALRNPRGRADVLDQIQSSWRSNIPNRDSDRTHVIAIWVAADTEDKRTELFTAIDTIEPDSPTLQRVRNLVEQLSAFVAANEEVYPHLDQFVESLGSASQEIVARWVNYVQSASSVEIELGSGALTGRLRDLLLTLGNYRTQSEGKSFPLFVIVEGIAGDLLDDAALEGIRAELDTLAKNRGVTDGGIARLRAEVTAARPTRRGGMVPEPGRVAAHRSILVRIEPNPEPKTPTEYLFRVYDWLPWETDAVARSMGGSRGRALNPSDALPSRPREALLPDGQPSELGQEIGRRLLRTPMSDPLIEFLVPAVLLCESFERIHVDPLGDAQFHVPLGTVARVVVRPLERWHPRFLKEKERLVALWRHRWQKFAGAGAGPLPAWFWKSNVVWTAVPGVLATAENRDVGCVGLGFAPGLSEMTERVYPILMAVGAPVALWMRSGDEKEVEPLLQRIVSAKDPVDLRDRVQGERANAAAAGASPAAELTLLWDDPERPPNPVDR